MKVAGEGYVGYVRVSTAEQARGDSPDLQEADLRAYALRQGIEIVAVEVDAGHSGKRLRRPGWGRVEAWLDGRRARGVLLAKLDRITRSVKDWEYLKDRYFGDRRPFSLLSASDHIDTRTANGRAMLGFQINVFQWERETIGERTKKQLAYRDERDLLVSRHPPYGWARVLDESPRVRGVPRTSHLVPVPAEQGVRAVILAMARDGAGPKKICTHLNKAGIQTRSGGRWIPGTVRAILRRAGRKGDLGVNETQGGGYARADGQ